MADNFAFSSTSVSLSSLVNTSSLETIFGKLIGQIAKLNDKVSEMEKQMKAMTTQPQFLSLQHEVESRHSEIDIRLDRLELATKQIDGIAGETRRFEQQIGRLREHQQETLRTRDFNLTIDELSARLTKEINNVRQEKADSSRLNLLFESQQTLTEHLSALESMLQFKVDKTQVPFVQNCAKRMDALETFRDRISQRVAVMDDQLCEVHDVVNEKVGKTEFSEEMESFEKIIAMKTDVSFVDEKILHPMEKMNDILRSVEEDMDGTTFSDIREKCDYLDGHLADVASESSQNRIVLADINKRLFKLPSLGQLDKKADRAYAEQLVEELKTSTCSTSAVVREDFKRVGEDLVDLKAITNDLEDKLSVVLKFVDWFSSAQLHKQASNPTSFGEL